MAIPWGKLEALGSAMLVSGVLVFTSIGVTLPLKSETYAVWPSGVIAIAVGPLAPAGSVMLVPAVLVCTSIGVTWLVVKSVTYAVCPSGVIAIPNGAPGIGILAPAVFV